MIKKTLAALAIGLSFTVAMAQEISFGIISTEATQNLKADWQPLLDDMEKQTGLKVKAFFAPDYAGIIEGMRFNKVQMAGLWIKRASKNGVPTRMRTIIRGNHGNPVAPG